MYKGCLVSHNLGPRVDAMFPRPENITPPDASVCISPADSRYPKSSIVALFAPVGMIPAYMAVEIALVAAQRDMGLCDQEVVDSVIDACLRVTPKEHAAKEVQTKHDIDALVQCIRGYLPEQYRPHVHWMATSFDIRSTAEAMVLRDATKRVVIPALYDLAIHLIQRASNEASTAMPGHTHLQQASPITVGFWYANHLARIYERMVNLNRCAGALRGKFSGPVGCHNDTVLVLPDPSAFEAKVLSYLNLTPALISTQITPPEAVADLMHALVTTSGVMSDMANDIRLLLMNEVQVLVRELDPNETGSSVMPNKINPSLAEQVAGLHRIMVGLSIVPLLNQESNLERDLRDSSAARIYGEMFNYTVHSVETLLAFNRKLSVNKPRLQELLQLSGGQTLAAAWNCLLRKHGHPDAHGVMKQVAQEARQRGISLLDAARTHSDLMEYYGSMTEWEQSVLLDPAAYIGNAPQQVKDVVGAVLQGLEVLGKECNIEFDVSQS